MNERDAVKDTVSNIATTVVVGCLLVVVVVATAAVALLVWRGLGMLL